MRYYYCPACERPTIYLDNVTVTVRGVHIQVKSEDLENGWTYFEAEEYKQPLIDIVGGECPDCGTALIIEEADECPHRWDTVTFYNRRRCLLCDVEQQGRMVFD